jgi:hypothetical protein
MRLMLQRLSVALLLLLSAPAFGAEAQRATTILESQVYVSPDTSSARLGTAMRGRELNIFEKSGNFVHVLAQVDAERTVTGWMQDRGVVTANTPNADQVVFGEAADSEHEAERTHGRKNAAQDAMRLYAWIAEFLPNSGRAAEAMYRAGDIRWQLEKAEMVGRPSNKEKDPYMRHQMDEDYLRKMIKKYPGTRWADLATWDLLDNKICGDWQGDPKCPEKESSLYLKYADDHPNSPRVTESLYNAAYRQAAAADLYHSAHDQKKQDEAKARALQILQRLSTQKADDFTAEGARLMYLVQQNIPVYEYISE